MQVYTDHIYKLKDPRDDSILGVRYVGKTNNPQGRYTAHISLRETNQDKNDWIQGLLDEGLLPIMEIIETITYIIPHEPEYVSSAQREKYWIHHYLKLGAPLFNVLKEPQQRKYPIIFKQEVQEDGYDDTLEAEVTRLRMENARLQATIQRVIDALGLDTEDIAG